MKPRLRSLTLHFSSRHHVEFQPAAAFSAAGDLAASNPQQSTPLGIPGVVETALELDAITRYLLFFNPQIVAGNGSAWIEAKQAAARMEHEALQLIVCRALDRGGLDEAVIAKPGDEFAVTRIARVVQAAFGHLVIVRHYSTLQLDSPTG
ncbi:MAG: hypothetical protein ABJA60_01835 [Nitrosospira sp.]